MSRMSAPTKRRRAATDLETSPEVRERILRTASELFYREGARAVGVDLVVARAGVAKTSLYRHFGTKDDLIAAFLEREDTEFWQQWDRVAQPHADDARAELDALLRWVGERVARENYRGCPQLNMAAEFPDAAHPARVIAVSHVQELRRRFNAIAVRLGADRPEQLAAQLLLLVNGAFVSSQGLAAEEAGPVLLAAARALLGETA